MHYILSVEDPDFGVILGEAFTEKEVSQDFLNILADFLSGFEELCLTRFHEWQKLEQERCNISPVEFYPFFVRANRIDWVNFITSHKETVPLRYTGDSSDKSDLPLRIVTDYDNFVREYKEGTEQKRLSAMDEFQRKREQKQAKKDRAVQRKEAREKAQLRELLDKYGIPKE